jgi:hypothetical protein
MVNKVDMTLFEFNNRNSIEQNLNLKRSPARKIKNWNSLVDHTENMNKSIPVKSNFSNSDRTPGGIVKQMVSSFSNHFINNDTNKSGSKNANEKDFFSRKSLSFNSKHSLINKQVTIFNRNSDNSLTETSSTYSKSKALTRNEEYSKREAKSSLQYEGKKIIAMVYGQGTVVKIV